ncbi:ribonuclease H-like domain-containing protein [Plesiocystis pacifica]|uniref:ribonuclease H-like domain-containing protein n=1 Tax=Plesiocystis pacifica TaxID=191768 RepID=UPI00030452B9|nr:ribonuclease H-like domain-containing protein [Plesiocystis pacifica]
MSGLMARLGHARVLHGNAAPTQPAAPMLERATAEPARERGFRVHGLTVGAEGVQPEASEGGPGGADAPFVGPGAANTRRFIARTPRCAEPALARALVCLGAQLPGAGRARPVFLDTETTGLGGGGSLAFVIGLAWYGDDGRLRVRQWVLERLGAEAAMLRAVLDTLRALGPAPLVTYNGASFDLPLLRMRAGRHRLAAAELDGETLEHLDLLHPTRRLWQGRAPDCRLGTLEELALGQRRRGDIPSAEIPEVFWDWLRARDEGRVEARTQRRLCAVLEHNCADLVSLPALAASLAREIHRPSDLDRARRAARHLARIGVEEQARTLLASWLDEVLDPRDLSGAQSLVETLQLRDAALELATLHRRAGERERAARLWRWAWSVDPRSPIAAEAWAKHLEHHARDYEGALRVAEGSRVPCSRRLSRLRARVARACPAPATKPAPAPFPAPVPAEPRHVAEPEPKRSPTPAATSVSQPPAASPRLQGRSFGSPIPSPRGVRSFTDRSVPRARKGELLERSESEDGAPRLRYRLLRRG